MVVFICVAVFVLIAFKVFYSVDTNSELEDSSPQLCRKKKSETKLLGFKSLFMGNVVHTRGWCVFFFF